MMFSRLLREGAKARTSMLGTSTREAWRYHPLFQFKLMSVNPITGWFAGVAAFVVKDSVCGLMAPSHHHHHEEHHAESAEAKH